MILDNQHPLEATGQAVGHNGEADGEKHGDGLGLPALGHLEENLKDHPKGEAASEKGDGLKNKTELRQSFLDHEPPSAPRKIRRIASGREGLSG